MKERELEPMLHSLQVQTWTRPSLGSHGQDESAPPPPMCAQDSAHLVCLRKMYFVASGTWLAWIYKNYQV